MKENWSNQLRSRGTWLTVGISAQLSLAIILSQAPVKAQIIPDNTLGSEASRLTPDVLINGLDSNRIDGGATRGTNLFHSFQEFNVLNGQQVYFANPTGIENILSRVTGANGSDIFGTLGVLGNASLYLINPNGIVFGPNAQLDVRGSFVGSTASGFSFPDGSSFSATNPEAPPLLTVNLTPGLQYGTSQPQAEIVNEGNLAAGEDLTLAGSNLNLSGQLQAGRDLTLLATDTVQVRDSAIAPFIAKAGGELVVQGNQAIDIFALNHPQSQIQSGGDFNLISNGNISGDAHFFSGGNLSMLTLSGTPGNFVSWFDPIIRANGDVQFGDYTGVALKVEATGSIQGGDIRITGPDATIPVDDPDYATLTQKPSVILRAGLDSVIPPNLPQNAGGTGFTGTSGLPLGITVGNIDTSISDGGDGGDIILSASEGNITTSELSSFSKEGNGGAIALTAGGSINLTNTSINSTSHAINGQAGNITIKAGSNDPSQPAIRLENTSIDAAAFGASGRTGNITIEAINGGSVELSGQARIYTDTFADAVGQNTGGDITIRGGSVNIDGYELIANVNEDAKGNGGNILITAANSIELRNEGKINTTTYSQGDAGEIELKADSILFEGDSDFDSSTYSSGNGGKVRLIANSSIEMRSQSGGGSNAYSTGNAGTIEIEANSLLINGKNSGFGTDTEGEGDGGTININVNYFKVENDGGMGSNTSGTGDAGVIEIEADYFEMNNGHINSNTSGTGDAGNIIVRASSILLTSTELDTETGQPVTTISTTSKKESSGQAGNISIEADSLHLDQSTLVTRTLGNVSNTKEGRANIELELSDSLFMENESLLSAEATGNANGGNITINTPLLVVLPPTGSDGSDIIARASEGNGGKINITARGIIGVNRRSSGVIGIEQRRAVEGNKTNDIDASSDLGVSGEVEINRAIDPSRGITALPEELIDASGQIAETCKAKGRGNEFSVTGRQGFPASSEQPLTGNNALADLGDGEMGEMREMREMGEMGELVSRQPREIVEAQGWVKQADGIVVLSAESSTVTSALPEQLMSNCQGS